MTKVVWISSFLPRSCGIAYYSSDYIKALKAYAKKKNKKISVKIIAHTDATKAHYPLIDLSQRDWTKKVLRTVEKEKPNVVHIQHEYGLYETYGDRNKNLLKLLEELKKENIPVVMTYHSVYEKLEPDHKIFIEKSLELISMAIFHEEYQKQSLKKNIGFVPHNIIILPHGSREHLHFDKEKLKNEFGYADRLVVGAAGIADERKGFRTLIRQWLHVVKKFPKALLSLEIKPHKAKETRDYISKVMEKIMKSKVSKNIEIVVKDYGKEEFYKKLASFDVLALPYKSESQSGVLAHGFAAGTPAVVTDIEGLGAEIRNSKAGIAVNPKERRRNFYKAIIKMLASKKLRDACSNNARKYVKTVSGWSIIAKKTLKVYEGLKR